MWVRFCGRLWACIKPGRLYRRILAAEPRHSDSLHLRGVIVHQRGEYAAAVQQIDAAIATNPTIAQAHNNRGVSLQALGRLDEALASFDTALALVSGYFDALRNRADTLAYLNRFEDAVGLRSGDLAQGRCR